MPIDRLAAADWLLATGDTAQAARLLTWVEADFGSSSFTAMVRGLAEFERAQIEDARGHPDLAQAHYRQFLTLYDMPMVPHRHLVEEAKAALARLSGRGDQSSGPLR